jgi:YggT family protein
MKRSSAILRRTGSLAFVAPLASTRTEIASYLSTLIQVYILLIILYVIVQLLFSVGVRPAYSRWLDMVLAFLRDICEPYLRIFRRFVPQIGPVDISPIVAVIVLEIFNGVVVGGIIHG